MANKKDAKETKETPKKDSKEAKSVKPQKGVRFLSVFSGDGTNFVFRDYPYREETNIQAASTDADLGKLVRKSYQTFKAQAK